MKDEEGTKRGIKDKRKIGIREEWKKANEETQRWEKYKKNKGVGERGIKGDWQKAKKETQGKGKGTKR